MTLPNTNSLSERLVAAHKRNVENLQAPTPVAAPVSQPAETAKQIAYRAGVGALESIVLRIEELERQVRELKTVQ
jgi:hypothetical protein